MPYVTEPGKTRKRVTMDYLSKNREQVERFLILRPEGHAIPGDTPRFPTVCLAAPFRDFRYFVSNFTRYGAILLYLEKEKFDGCPVRFIGLKPEGDGVMEYEGVVDATFRDGRVEL